MNVLLRIMICIALIGGLSAKANASVHHQHRRHGHHPVIAPDTFDFQYNGDVSRVLFALKRIQPELRILDHIGHPSTVPVKLDLHGVGLDDTLLAINEQTGSGANIIYDGYSNTVRVDYRTHAHYGTSSSIEARHWQRGGDAKPIMGTAGLLEYPYGQGQPEITCAPLRACDVQLQAGEVINNVYLGDTVRWLTAPAFTGDGKDAVPHVILKPTEAGISTNMVITTNRRTYVMTLKSSHFNYVSRVGFYYPGDMVKQWNGQALLAQVHAMQDKKQKVADLPITSIDQLNLDGYTIKGDKRLPWYPVRVFDDGSHVWIQMPKSIHAADAPALVLLNKDGDSELVNYRVRQADQGGRKVLYYIVDKLFKRAGLIVGVGSDQKRIEIDRRDPERY